MMDIPALRAKLEEHEKVAERDVERAMTVETREFSTGYRAALRYVLYLLKQEEAKSPPSHAPFVPADPTTCTCVNPFSNCPTHG